MKKFIIISIIIFLQALLIGYTYENKVFSKSNNKEYIMAFKREKITDEKDMVLFDSYEFVTPANVPIKSYYVDTRTINSWSIDRERNAFLTKIGGGGHAKRPDIYVLVWNNNVIVFAFDRTYKKNEKGEDVKYVKILRIFAPKSLAGHDDEIINLIKESIIGDYFGSPIPIHEFEFKYKPQYILEGDDYKNQNILNRL